MSLTRTTIFFFCSKKRWRRKIHSMVVLWWWTWELVPRAWKRVMWRWGWWINYTRGCWWVLIHFWNGLRPWKDGNSAKRRIIELDKTLVLCHMISWPRMLLEVGRDLLLCWIHQLMLPQLLLFDGTCTIGATSRIGMGQHVCLETGWMEMWY